MRTKGKKREKKRGWVYWYVCVCVCVCVWGGGGMSAASLRALRAPEVMPRLAGAVPQYTRTLFKSAPKKKTDKMTAPVGRNALLCCICCSRSLVVQFFLYKKSAGFAKEKPLFIPNTRTRTKERLPRPLLLLPILLIHHIHDKREVLVKI